MFSFLKRKKYAYDLSFLQVDIHSHLLPGIDDGASDKQLSLQYLQQLESLGLKKTITTPHIISDLYPNSPETIQQVFEDLQPDIKNKKLGIELSYAAEYMINAEFEEIMHKDKLLTLGSSQYVLVEMPYLAEFPNIQQVIFDLCMKGYKPILAHPERYNYYNGDINKYEAIKNWGCCFQMNLLSPSGYYGHQVKAVALQLLKHNLYDFAGTDLHHHRHIEAIQSFLQTKAFGDIQKYPFQNPIFLSN